MGAMIWVLLVGCGIFEQPRVEGYWAPIAQVTGLLEKSEAEYAAADYAAALVSVDAALNLHMLNGGRLADALAHKGRVLLALGELDAALLVYAQGLEVEQTSELYVGLAKVQQAKGDAAGAQLSSERASALER